MEINQHSANIVSGGVTSATAFQPVQTDLAEAAPVITGVTDSSSASIANAGATFNPLQTVSGTGIAGDVVYLYDNTANNLVGSTTVDSSGNWTVSVLGTDSGGTNQYAAKQQDALGNLSKLSNTYTVNSSGVNQLDNGDFANGLVGFTTSGLTYQATYNGSGNVYGLQNYAGNGVTTAPSGASTLSSGSYSHGSFTTTGLAITRTVAGFNAEQNLFFNYYASNGTGDAYKVLATSADTVPQTVTSWSQNVNVIAGRTYKFTFTENSNGNGTNYFSIGGSTPVAWDAGNTSNMVVATVEISYTATSTGLIPISLTHQSTVAGGSNDTRFANMKFVDATTTPDGSLVADTFMPGTTSDNTALVYTGGGMASIDGNDTITVQNSDLQTKLSAGGFINGGTGVDTLKLAANTNLNLETLTNKQTVKAIQEVEIFQLQGGSTLTLSANDVLSLGGVNLSGYSFASTTGGTASTGSTGKVQFVVTGTSTDSLVLDPLQTDGVTTNGVVGNTGLAGQWDYMGTTTISGTSYKVFNSSNTAAQLLTTIDPTIKTNAIAFSSMTKDSGPAGATNDWLTADVSAGRLISGTVGTPLTSGDVVNVYANGTLIGTATVNAAGTAWQITDTNGYTGNWVYSANIVSGGVTSATAFQPVQTDLTEAAPVITGVTDSASASVANAGSTNNALSTVSGTGNAGNTVYLYDNRSTNLVGSATVDTNGSWTITGLVGTFTGSNTFSAKQIDALGNSSLLSNLWAVSALGTSSVINGDFSSGNTGFATTASYGLQANRLANANQYTVENTTLVSIATSSTLNNQTTTSSNLTWSKSFSNTTNSALASTVLYNPDGAMTGNYLAGSIIGPATLWRTTVNVVAGQTYAFKVDYANNRFGTLGLTATIDGTTFSFENSQTWESGHLTATYVATTTKQIALQIDANNTGLGTTAATGDYWLDNFSFTTVATGSNANTLANGTAAPGTAAADTVTYAAGMIDTLAGNDVITATDTGIQAKLAAGVNAAIDGGSGHDTLLLAAGTTLDLTAITDTQTVVGIQEIEHFALQGSSRLTLNVNDVLSLGGVGANALSFSATTLNGTSTNTSNVDQVQLVIDGTATDLVTLASLTSNPGNAGTWQDMGQTGIINGHTYGVFNYSTTHAQILIDTTILNANHLTLS